MALEVLLNLTVSRWVNNKIREAEKEHELRRRQITSEETGETGRSSSVSEASETVTVGCEKKDS